MENLLSISAIDTAAQTTNSDKTKTQNKKTENTKPKSSTNLILGYKDESVGIDEIDGLTSKLGGTPDWLINPIPDYNKTVSCLLCKKNMHFILQLYAPLDASPYDRTLYIFACSNSSCKGRSDSIKVLRALRYNLEYAKKLKAKTKPPKKVAPKPTMALGDLWGSTDSAFSFNKNANMANLTDSFGKASLSPVCSDKKDLSQEKPFANIKFSTPSSSEKICANPSSTPWPDNISSFPAHYISTGPEEPAASFDCSNIWDMSNHAELIEKYTNFESQNDAEESWMGEVYEKSDKPNGVDKAFLNFSSRASQSPGHFLRYDLGGTPLLYSLTCPVADQLLGFPSSSKKRSKLPITNEHLPKCVGCGGRRIFEFQLMPHLLSELKPSSQTHESQSKCASFLDFRNLLLNDSGWDFGTVLVFTCENDCVGSQETYMDELALIQVESSY